MTYCIVLFLASDFCRFCVVIRFFIPATTANDLRLRKIFIPDFIHYIFGRPMTSDFEGFLSQILSITCLSYLNPSGIASISRFNVECHTRELLVPFILRFWYDAVLDLGFNQGPPELEASTLPLGCRGSGV